MTLGIAAVRDLLGTAATFAPGQVRIVATSAVRDAANGAEFADRLLAATGHCLQILSGSEEARLIGRGIACEPALQDAVAFHVFDLGGGSLEMLTLVEGRITQLASLPLGCVRITEQCIADPAQPLTLEESDRIRELVRSAIAASDFHFNLPPGSPAVVTGGTATTLRAMRAAAWGRALAVESPVLAVTELRRFGAQLAEMSLAERRRLPGLPAPRADVITAAVITLQELARAAGVDAFRHSFYNLRYGLAAELLGIQPPAPAAAPGW